MKKNLLSLLGFLTVLTMAWGQQPNWSVNESDFQYSMTLVCRLNIDGRFLTSENDLVGAFVNNEVRGVSSPSYISSQEKYFTYVTVFSNQQGEDISFRIYDSSSNAVRQVDLTLDFVANKHTGSFFQSVSIAAPALNTEAQIHSFDFVDVPVNDSIIELPQFTYYIPNIISKETLVPIVRTSEGASVYIDQRTQTSGESVVNLSSPVVYQVLSQDESTLNTFTLIVEHSFNDYDGDGLEDEFDLDDDDDCFSDELEEELRTNPLDASDFPEDIDNDCIPDALDDDVGNNGFPDDTLFVNAFFSPNGDGINDSWVIVNILKHPNNQVWIYNRSGRIILNKNSYQNDWTGTMNGNDLPEGNYFYRIDKESDGQIDNEGWFYLGR